MHTPEIRPLLTQKETASYTRLSENTLAKYRCEGGGPKFTKLGSRVLYPREEIERWIAENTVSSTSEQASTA